MVCFSLPEYFVVPVYLTNADLQKAAGQYTEKRLPVSQRVSEREGDDFVPCVQQLAEDPQHILSDLQPTNCDRLHALCFRSKTGASSLQDINYSSEREKCNRVEWLFVLF